MSASPIVLSVIEISRYFGRYLYPPQEFDDHSLSPGFYFLPSDGKPPTPGASLEEELARLHEAVNTESDGECCGDSPLSAASRPAESESKRVHPATFYFNLMARPTGRTGASIPYRSCRVCGTAAREAI
ncbi:hypothetical protein B566_EDAN016941 [Ephemera danica]|nr:hypothetical protein B566_EDAN016941 [Ephemera danica]